MTHKTLISTIATKSNLPKEEVEKMLEETVLFFSEKLSEGKSIGIQSFGTLEAKKKEERLSVHPITKERMLIPPKQVVSFKQSSLLKEKLKALPYE